MQLEQFFAKLRDDLQVTRLSHFDYVKTDDLEKIGMSKPSARRLIDACKKRKSTLRKKSLFHRILGACFTLYHLFPVAVSDCALCAALLWPFLRSSWF